MWNSGNRAHVGPATNKPKYGGRVKYLYPHKYFLLKAPYFIVLAPWLIAGLDSALGYSFR